MEIQNRTLPTDMSKYYKIMRENTYGKEINKVFIPFRSILEMELLLSSLLAKENYEKLSRLPFTCLDVKYITRELGISQKSVFTTIFDRFFLSLQKIIPIANKTRYNDSHTRYGNVNAYTKSRIPVFYAMDRLKFKLLLLHNFLRYLREHHYLLSAFPSDKQKADKSFESILFAEYCSRMKGYFETVTWESEYQSKFLEKPNTINFKALCLLNQFQIPDENMNVIYIMRSIRASYLLSKITFKMMDVEEPFLNEHGSIESLILNRDILPGMLSAINNAYRIGEMNKVRELVDMFEKYLAWMIEGVDYGYTLASNNQLKPNSTETLYYSGDLLFF